MKLMSNQQKLYLPNLDALRFVLSIIVIVHHTAGLSKNQELPYLSDLSIFDKATEAVYLFFVLSGYLIIRSIYREKNSQSFSIKNFYARRALRILPLYYCVGLFGLIFYHVILPNLGIAFENEYSLPKGLVMITAMVPNVLFTYNPGGILEVLWSIGLEEQFYLGIAPILMFTRVRHFLKVLISLFVVSFLLFHSTFISLFKDFGLVYFFLICGGLVAICQEKGFLDFLLKSKLLKIIILLVVPILFFTNVLRFENNFHYDLLLCAALGMFIPILSNLKRPFVVTSKTINYLGQISYGTYLLHNIVLYFVVFSFLELKIESDILSILLINLITISMTFLESHLSYKYFESYFLRKKKNFRISISSKVN